MTWSGKSNSMHGPEAKVNNDKDLFDHNDNYEGVATFPWVQLRHIEGWERTDYNKGTLPKKNTTTDLGFWLNLRWEGVDSGPGCPTP